MRVRSPALGAAVYEITLLLTVNMQSVSTWELTLLSHAAGWLRSTDGFETTKRFSIGYNRNHVFQGKN